MKTIKYLPMLLMIVAMNVIFTSCSKDDNDDKSIEQVAKFTLEGSQWSYTDKYEESGIEMILDYTISFSSSTALYNLTLTMKEGTQTTTQNDRIQYTYTYSDGLVILKPQEANKAYLEGKIISNIKMEVTNVSTGKNLGTFYKQ